MNKVKAGEVILKGKSLKNTKNKDIAKNIALVHQQNQVPADLTVQELVSFGRVPHKKNFQAYSEEDEKLIQWSMAATGVDKYKNNKVMELSGGERQRVFISMALAQNTDILFLDEPTTYLDIYHQIQVLDIIRKLNKENGITVVMVLHDINQAIQYSDNIIVMKDGKNIAAGNSKNILNTNVIKQVYGVSGVMTEEIEGNFYFIPIQCG